MHPELPTSYGNYVRILLKHACVIARATNCWVILTRRVQTKDFLEEDIHVRQGVDFGTARVGTARYELCALFSEFVLSYIMELVDVILESIIITPVSKHTIGDR